MPRPVSDYPGTRETAVDRIDGFDEFEATRSASERAAPSYHQPPRFTTPDGSMARDSTFTGYIRDVEEGNLDVALNPLTEAQFADSSSGVQRGATQYRSDDRSPSDQPRNVAENPGYDASSPDNPGFGLSPTHSGSNIGVADVALAAGLARTTPMTQQKTMKNFVHTMMRNLPSQNREFVNLVNLQNQKRKPIRQADLSMLMHDPVSGPVSREGSPAQPTAIRSAGSELNRDRRPSVWLGQNDAVTQLMQEVQRSPGSPVTIARQASSPARIRSDTDGTMYNHAQSMLDVVKGQDSRMEVKRERVKLLKENMRQNSTLMARWRLWLILTQVSVKIWYEKVLHVMERSTLWHDSIKELEGRHGAHVGIYFNFLRWCLFLNLVIGLMWATFVVIPFAVQFGFSGADKIIYYDNGGKPTFTAGDVAIGLLNGGGILNASAYFMGSYNFPDFAPKGSLFNQFNAEPNESYDVRMAYVATGGMYLFISFCLIFHGVFEAIVSATAVQGTDEGEILSRICFFRYDNSITSEDSVNRHKLEITREILDLLGDMDDRDKHKEKMQKKFYEIYAKRIAINILIWAMLVGSLYAIYSTVTQYSDGSSIERLVPAVVLALVNASVPFFFEILAEMEEWRNRLIVIKITILRSVILRIVGLYVFFGAAMLRRHEYGCWESFMGQEVYTVFIVGSLIFEMITSSFIDIWVTVIHRRFPVARVLLADPAYFDTIKKVMELVYAQTVIWIGTLFCPLLPFVGILRCIILFKLQKWSTLNWCEPKGTAFLAKYSLPSLIWYLLLGGFVLAAVPLGYVFPRVATSGGYMSDAYQDRFVTQRLKQHVNTTPGLECGEASQSISNCLLCIDPAATESSCVEFTPAELNVSLLEFCSVCPPGCGPFRYQSSAYETLDEEYSNWNDSVKEVFLFMGTVTFTVFLSILLLAICCVTQARSTARLAWGKKMRLERDMERMDKKFIIRHLDLSANGDGFSNYDVPTPTDDLRHRGRSLTMSNL